MTEDTIGAEVEYGPPLAGSFTWPRPGASGAFHFRRTSTHEHQGVDLVVEEGRDWLALADGDVTSVVTAPGSAPGFAGYGRVVVVRHKDRETGRYVWALYAHGSRVDVEVGQHVRRGQVLGAVGRSQFARHPRRPEGSMGAHLHHELSLHAYPQGSEAPTRIDPVAHYAAHGIVPIAPAPREGAQRPASAAPDTEPMAKVRLRELLMLRVAQTDGEVARTAAQLQGAGHTLPATLLVGAWRDARAVLWPLLVRSSRLEEVRSAVVAWLARIDALAEQARSVVPEAMAATVADIRARLRRIWTEGIDWTTTRLATLARQVSTATVGAGVLLLLLGLAWLARESSG